MAFFLNVASHLSKKFLLQCRIRKSLREVRCVGRARRIWVPHLFYHIVCRGNRRDLLFKEVNDFRYTCTDHICWQQSGHQVIDELDIRRR